MMTVLITGAAGFIGSHLADRLLHHNHRVVAIDNFDDQYPPEIKRHNIAHACQKHNYILYETDIRQEKTVNDILSHEKPDVVVHLAAYVGTRTSFDDFPSVLSNNVLGTQTVLDACRLHRTEHVIITSSSTVYGKKSGLLSEDIATDSPQTPYAASKLMNELMAFVYHSKNALRFTILRIFNTYGPRQRSTRVIPVFIQKMMKGEPVPIFHNGSIQHNFIYIDDCITAIVKAIQQPFEYEIINIGGQVAFSLTYLADLIAKYLSISYKVAYPQTNHPRPGRGYADISKARELLGFEPQCDIAQGIHLYVQWRMDSTRSHVQF